MQHATCRFVSGLPPERKRAQDENKREALDSLTAASQSAALIPYTRPQGIGTKSIAIPYIRPQGIGTKISITGKAVIVIHATSCNLSQNGYRYILHTMCVYLPQLDGFGSA